jgi:nitrate/nitrite transport system ATP-binding protein
VNQVNSVNPNPEKYLECWKLTKTFPTPKGEFTAVIDFDLNVAEGEFIAIIGHSGCGKSTVLQMVAGLHTVTSGALILDNKEVRDAGPDRAVVFQSPHLLPWMTALQNVLIGVEQVKPELPHAQRVEIATHYLSLVGLKHALHKRPTELSQGMQQRVGIARAFALQPKLLLLDEPFGMLDALTRLELQDVLLDVWRESRVTALMVTHDVDEAVFLSDRVVMMTNGPAATVGEILAVPFPRPRERAIIATPEYIAKRDAILAFLESQDHKRAGPRAATSLKIDPTKQSRVEHVLQRA